MVGGKMEEERMTELLDKAVKTARSMSPDVQDEIARIVLSLVDGDSSVYQLTQEEEASFSQSRGESRRREFATPEQVLAVWSKHKP